MIKNLSQTFSKHEKDIETWLAQYKKPLSDPLYASVDLRNAGFKLGPVDTNIFPGGWNNICPKSKRLAAEKLKGFFERNYPEVRRILILPEHHTRNLFYLTNLSNLKDIVELAGFETKIGNFNPENQEETLSLENSEGAVVTQYKIHRAGNKLMAGDFEADAYLLNNDLSGGIPEMLQNLEKPFVPTPSGGWHTRIKSDHFHYYRILVEMFAKRFEFDPWLISPYFDHEEEVDFQNTETLKQLAVKIDILLGKIAAKYAEYGITQKPFVFIKNESGTYGMGITTVEKGEDVLNFNRDERKKMTTGKDKVRISKVIIQEGIPTSEMLGSKIAEPVLYMIDSEVVGGFFRLHSERSDRENLNASGMTFSNICIHEPSDYVNTFDSGMKIQDMMPVYKIIAELASIATGYELIGLQNKA